MKRIVASFTLAGAAAFLLAGCQTVKPWQRGTLSDYTMRGDRDPIGEAQARRSRPCKPV